MDPSDQAPQWSSYPPHPASNSLLAGGPGSGLIAVNVPQMQQQHPPSASWYPHHHHNQQQQPPPAPPRSPWLPSMVPSAMAPPRPSSSSSSSSSFSMLPSSPPAPPLGVATVPAPPPQTVSMETGGAQVVQQQMAAAREEDRGGGGEGGGRRSSSGAKERQRRRTRSRLRGWSRSRSRSPEEVSRKSTRRGDRDNEHDDEGRGRRRSRSRSRGKKRGWSRERSSRQQQEDDDDDHRQADRDDGGRGLRQRHGNAGSSSSSSQQSRHHTPTARRRSDDEDKDDARDRRRRSDSRDHSPHRRRHTPSSSTSSARRGSSSSHQQLYGRAPSRSPSPSPDYQRSQRLAAGSPEQPPPSSRGRRRAAARSPTISELPVDVRLPARSMNPSGVSMRKDLNPHNDPRVAKHLVLKELQAPELLALRKKPKPASSSSQKKKGGGKKRPRTGSKAGSDDSSSSSSISEDGLEDDESLDGCVVAAKPAAGGGKNVHFMRITHSSKGGDNDDDDDMSLGSMGGAEDSAMATAGELTTKEMCEIFNRLMKCGFIRFSSSGPQQCPVSFQQVSNWKVTQDHPALKNWDEEELQRLELIKAQLIAGTTKEHDSLLCHGRNEGFKELKFLYSHCHTTRSSTMHGLMATYIEQTRPDVVEQLRAQSGRAKRILSKLGGPITGKRSFLWPPVVYISNVSCERREDDFLLPKNSQVLKRLIPKATRIFADPRGRDMVVVFDESADGLETARALVDAMRCKEERAFGPTAQADLPSLPAFEKLLEELPDEAFGKLKNARFTEKSKAEIDGQAAREQDEKLLKLQAAQDNLLSQLDKNRALLAAERERRRAMQLALEEEQVARIATDKAREHFSKQLAVEAAKHEEEKAHIKQRYEAAVSRARDEAEKQYRAMLQQERDTFERRMELVQKAQEDKWKQKEAEVAHNDEEVQKLRETQEMKRQRHAEMQKEIQRLRQKNHAGRTAVEELAKKQAEDRQELDKKLEEVARREAALESRCMQGAVSKEEFEKLKKEVEEAQDEVQTWQNDSFQNRRFSEMAKDAKGALLEELFGMSDSGVNDDLRGGLCGRFELDATEAFYPMFWKQFWLEWEALREALFEKEDSKLAGSNKSEEQQRRLADKAWDELNDIMRLMEGRANPKENFCPFVRKAGRIVGMNRDDYHMQQIIKKYGEPVAQLVYESMIKVDEYCGSGRYPTIKLWNQITDSDMDLVEAVRVVVTRLVELAPMLASQGRGPPEHHQNGSSSSQRKKPSLR